MNNPKKIIFCGYCVVATLISAIFVCITFEWDIFYGIFVGCAAATICAKALGFSAREIWKMSIKNVKNVSPIAIMLFIIGATIGLWMAGGVIGTFVFYGLKYLSGMNMVLLAFLLCSVMSCVLGTAMGALTTLGVVFIGISQALGINMALMAGAIVSGCYLGDRTAPLSGIVNLTATMTGTDMLGNVKYMLKYTIIGILVSGIFYWFFGSKFGAMSSRGGISDLLALLSNNFEISPWLMLPLVLMVALVLVFKRDIVQSLLITLIFSLIGAVFFLKMPIREILNVLCFGFHPADIGIAKIISGSGFLSMVGVILSVIFSAVLNGLLEGTQMLTLLLDKLNKPTIHEWRLMANAAITSIVLTLVTCNQPICCMATGSYFSPKFDELKITRRSLAHIICDNGIIISPVIPWNVNALMAVSVTGVAALKFLPFTIMCFILPILTYINIYRAYKNPDNI